MDSKKTKVSWKDWHIFYKITVPQGIGVVIFCAVHTAISVAHKKYLTALLQGLCALSSAMASLNLISSAQQKARQQMAFKGQNSL